MGLRVDTKVGDAVSFTAANGMVFTGTVIQVRADGSGRTWFSVKTPDSRCPFPVTEDQLTEAQ